MKTARFCICILLVPILLVSYLPADVFAADHSCGENATWSFKYGCLTISGKGRADDFTIPPWHELNIAITSVVIEEGITAIGSGAFRYCQNLKSVSFPSTLTSIGNHAFTGCYALAEIDLPDQLKRIGMEAFKDCYKLTSIAIPASVERFDSGAFQGCSGLKEVYISDLEAWCNIIFDYGKSNPLHNSADLYLNDELVTDLVIPEGVTDIHSSAFTGCASIHSVTFPEGLTWIGGYAFQDCYNLQSITLPSTIETIHEGAFRNCYNLKQGYYGGTQEQMSQILVYENNDALLSLSWQLPPQNMLPIYISAAIVGELVSVSPTLIGLIIIFILKRKRKI